MSGESINRAYLETLIFSDLVNLADKYGVDVPDDLDRRFLIAELLELVEESGSNSNTEEMKISHDGSSENTVAFIGNYNETQISCILRNPAWLFVFWNISENDSTKIKKSVGSSLKLRICSLSDSKSMSVIDDFEVQTVTDSQEQYVLIPKDEKFLKVDLICECAGTKEILAFSPVITIPHGSSLVNDLQPGRDVHFSPVVELSGMKLILTEQYKNHRHSFS